MIQHPKHQHVICSAPFGAIRITASEVAVTELQFLPPGTSETPPSSALLQQAIFELQQYFENPHHRFQFPWISRGTEFQHRVWTTISQIPCGQSRTYGALAKQLKTAPQALGQACGANPCPIVVPCHRVVGQRNLGGFAHTKTDWLLHTKQWLLCHESAC